MLPNPYHSATVTVRNAAPLKFGHDCEQLRTAAARIRAPALAGWCASNAKYDALIQR